MIRSEPRLLLAALVAGTLSGCLASDRPDDSTEVYRTFLATHFLDGNLHEIYLLDRTTEQTPFDVLRECPEASGFNGDARFADSPRSLDQSIDGFGRYRLVDETESKAILDRLLRNDSSDFDFSNDPPGKPDEAGLVTLQYVGVVYLSQILFNDDRTKALVSYGLFQQPGEGFGGAAMFERFQRSWKHSRDCGGWVT